jgi:HEPN domain-containing protein
MDRSEFRTLTAERLDDAVALLEAGRYACAYYVCGYAVECALKACICRMTRQDYFPPKDAARYYVHDLAKLLDIANLKSEFDKEKERDSAFSVNWAVVKDWSEESRYQGRQQQQARELVKAVSDPQHGVLRWLRENW